MLSAFEIAAAAAMAASSYSSHQQVKLSQHRRSSQQTHQLAADMVNRQIERERELLVAMGGQAYAATDPATVQDWRERLASEVAHERQVLFGIAADKAKNVTPKKPETWLESWAKSPLCSGLVKWREHYRRKRTGEIR